MELLAISIVLNIALVIVIFIGILYHNFCVSSLIEEIETGYWWFLSSIVMREEHFINELVSLDIELSEEAFKDHTRSFKGTLNYIQNNHPEFLL